MVPERHRRPYGILQMKMAAITGEIPENLPEKERDRLVGLAVMTKQPELMTELDDALMIAFIEAWSYDFPVSKDALLDLPGKAIDILKERCRELRPRMMTEFEPTVDPASPTVPSSG